MSTKRDKVGVLLKQCGIGNRLACAAARLHVIDAGSVLTFRSISEDSDHPNRMPFKGILLITDQASTKPPHGSMGHRILVPTAVARKKLRGLIGMAVNYDREDLDGHVSRHKVGVITKAWMEDTRVWVEGFIYKKDFPEAAKDLKDRRDLGMSMELADVYVRDEHESVWNLLDFEFTGAAILKKSAAAYYGTSLAASQGKQTALAAQAAAVRRKEKVMNKDKKVKAAAADTDHGNSATAVLTQSIATAVGAAVRDAVGEVRKDISAMSEQLEQTTSDVEELKGLYVIEAAGKHDDDDDDDDDDMAAKSDDDDDDDDDMAAARKAKGDDEEDDQDDDDDDVDAEVDLGTKDLEDLEEEPAEEEPGEVNKKRGGKNKGDKQTVTDPPTQGAKVKGNIAEGRLKSAAFQKLKSSASISAAAIRIEQLSAQIDKANKRARRAMQAAAEMATQNKKMKKLVDKMEAQLDRAAEQTNRRSVVPIEVRNLLAKGGVDLGSLQASGQKLTVEAMDQVFAEAAAAGIILEPDKRAGFKNILTQRGLLESGEVTRDSWN